MSTIEAALYYSCLTYELILADKVYCVCLCHYEMSKNAFIAVVVAAYCPISTTLELKFTLKYLADLRIEIITNAKIQHEMVLKITLNS